MACASQHSHPDANVWTTKLEHEAGIGPAIAVLQTASLPLADSCKIGASGGTRTPTPFLAADFESAVSANSIHRRTKLEPAQFVRSLQQSKSADRVDNPPH